MIIKSDHYPTGWGQKVMKGKQKSSASYQYLHPHAPANVVEVSCSLLRPIQKLWTSHPLSPVKESGCSNH